MNAATELKIWRRMEASEFRRAQQVAPYNDDAKVAAMTQELLQAGKRLFQLFRLHKDDDMHVARLLELFDLPHGAKVLDIGCGVGTMAMIMHCMRPDLEITLLNISQAQLDLCPHEFERIKADMHHVPAANGSFDAVMVCYALGHGVLAQVADEVARLLVPGGRALFVDIFAPDYAPLLAAKLGYAGYAPARLMAELQMSGLRPVARIDENQFEMPEWIAATLPAGTLDGVVPLAMVFEKAGA